MGEVNAELAIGACIGMAEYYIETGKPSSAPLGAMGDKLCKGLEAANNVNTGTSTSRFSLTMNELSFDRRPAHATDRSGPAVFDARYIRFA
jgi:hypothetical protein